MVPGQEQVMACSAAPVAAQWASRGAANWPQLSAISPVAFAAYLTERLPPDGAEAANIVDARVDELYLACACTRGDERAIELFEARYFAEIDYALGRRGHPTRDELYQSVREKLWVGGGAGPPKIASYRGAGALRRWLRILVNRCVVDQARATERARRSERALGALAGPMAAATPELLYIKRTQRRLFGAAFERAVRELTPEQRLLLRQHHLHRLSLDQLGAIVRAHPVTVSRRLSRARAAILRTMRAELRRTAQLAPAEVDEVMGLANSALDLSLSRIFSTTAA